MSILSKILNMILKDFERSDQKDTLVGLMATKEVYI